MNVCTAIYQLSRIDLRNDFFLPILCMLVCVLFEIFVYCYFGEKMKNKVTKLIQ